MKVGLGLRLSAAIVACAALTPDAFAGGQATPGNTLTYSAESVALAPGNVVRINGNRLRYSVVGVPMPGVAGGPTVTFSAPPLDLLTQPGPAVVSCLWNGAISTSPTGFGTNAITCPNPGAGGPYTFVMLSNPGGGAVGAISLTGPDVAALGQNIFPFSNPRELLPINAQATSSGAFVGDSTPLPNLALSSQNSARVDGSGQDLLIDLTGSGVAAGNLPGGVFAVDNPDGTRGVSKTGFLGTLQVRNRQSDLDARTALNCIGGPALGNNVNCATSIFGPVSVKLTGDFATLTSAFLLPNVASGGLLVAGPANCGPAAAAVAPANANQVAGTIDAAKRNITFAAFTARASDSVYAVCLVTNGTQVIQPTSVNWVVSEAFTGGPTITLTAANAGFSTITYAGSSNFFSNVFGIQTGTRTYIRAVNNSNVAAQIWAVMTNDVPNQSPEVGAGSCAFPVAATTASTSQDTATCNTSFVANLTSPFVTSNSATSAGLLQPNTATYYTADDIAAIAGTTATNPANTFLESTVRMMSPNGAVVFTSLAVGAFGILTATP